MKTIRFIFIPLSIGLFVLLSLSGAALAQDTAFTHQGRLSDNGAPATGQYDLQFALFDAAAGGAQQGATSTLENVQVTNGVFSVQLDFGAVFTGAARWLEVRVRPGASTGAFTLLTPRQPLAPAPYAIHSRNTLNLGGVAASGYLQTNGNGSALTNLNAASITSGTLSNARLGVVPIANGGTGSATQNFVDLTTAQTVGGAKTFSGNVRMQSGTVIGQFRVGGLAADGFITTNEIQVSGLTTTGVLRIESVSFGDRRNLQWDDETKGLFQDNSSRRYKENIRPLTVDFARLLQAVPMAYTRPGSPQRWEIGFIAEEMDALGLTELVEYDKEGRPDGVRYDKVPLYLTRLAATQQQELNQLKTENATLKARLDALQALVCAAQPAAAACRP